MKTEADDIPMQELESDLIHSPFYPEQIRENDVIEVEIESGIKKGKTLTYRLWTISPLGMEILLDDENELFEIGREISVAVKYKKFTINHKGLLIRSVSNHKKGKIVGIRWISDKNDSFTGEDRRDFKRWLCGSEFMPTGVCSNPLRFNDFIHFQVKDLSKTGLMIVTSMRNKLLVPGMILKTTLTFPGVGQSYANIEVIHPRVVQKNGKEYLSLGCRFIKPDKFLLELIAQYLLQFSPDPNPADLLREGLQPKSVLAGVTFNNVRTEAELYQVLSLRKKAWVGRDKFAGDEPEDTFGDVYDARARIVSASHKGKCIGSLRIVFPDEQHDLEHSQYLVLPDNLPRKDEMVEITRVVTDPEFRRSDLLYGMLNYAGSTILQQGKRYILGNSEHQYLKLYEKLGAQILPYEFEVQKLKIKVKLFLIDILKCVTGENVHPIVWNLIYRDIAKYLKSNGYYETTSTDNLRMLTYRSLAPATDLFMKVSKLRTKNRRRKAG